MNHPRRGASYKIQTHSFCLGFCVAAVSIAVVGCTDQQKEVSHYRNVLDGPHPAALRRDYSQGQPLTLEQSLLLANRYNEQLAIQGENYLQGLIARDRAYSTFMPTISLAPTYSFQNKPLNRGGTFLAGGTGTGTTGGGTTLGGTGGGTSTGSVVAPANKYTALDVPVTARANLFNGFRDYSSIQEAYADIRRRRGVLLDLQQTILLETAQTYYNVLLAERSVEVLQNSVKYQEARVADILNRFHAGIAQPLDVAQTQAQAAATRVQLITARSNVHNTRVMLAFLTDARVESAKLVDRLVVPVKLISPQEAVIIAQRVRPDIAATRAAVEVTRRNVQVAIGEYYPSISLNLNYYLSRATFPTNVEWAGVLSANLPIFSAGTIEADVRLAWSQLRQNLLSEWQLLRQVQQDVQVDWQNLAASRARIVELRSEVAASQEAYRQADQRYHAGLAINLDVINAQSLLLSSQLDLATEEFNHKIYYLDLLRAMGELPRPAGADSMSSGPPSRPTTEETQPVLPAPGGQMSVPTTEPSGEPSTQPQPESIPTTFPAPMTDPAATEPVTPAEPSTRNDTPAQNE
jgi:outer membrane protein TolC